MPALQQSLYPSSSESKGNAGNASLCTSQSVFYNHMMEEIRDAIDAGNFAEYKKMRLEGFEEGKINSKDNLYIKLLLNMPKTLEVKRFFVYDV